MSKKQKSVLILTAGIFFIVIMIIISILWMKERSSSKHHVGLLTTAQIKKNLDTKLIMTQQKDQKATTANYQAAAENSNYSLETPYIKINPYGTSPLTALIIFTSSQKATVSYTVVGKTADTSITNTVNGGAQTVHQVPIVGLYANASNTIKMTVKNADGTTDTKTFHLKTTSLPKYINAAKITVKTADKAQMEIGTNKLTIINRTTKEPFAIDADGAVRWYSTNYSQHTIEHWSNGHYMILTKSNVHSQVYNDLEEVDLLGRVYKEFSFSDKTSGNDGGTETTVIHHDLLELPNGNLLATVSDGSKFKEDIIAEISYKTGKIVKLLDMKKILPQSMYKNYAAGTDGKIDWLHMNALDYDQSDGGVLISNRNQDLTMKLNWQTGKIDWLYSGKAKSSWPKSLQKYVLKPSKGISITGGQHGVTLLSSPTSESENILLYDNNINVTNGDKTTSGKYSQAVQYHIDLKKMIITQTWAYGKVLGKTNFTSVIGYAERQRNGNTLIDFGYKNSGAESNIIEVDKAGQQVFNITIKNAASKAYVYRAYREEFYDSSYIFDARK